MFRSLASLAVVASASSLSIAQLIDLTTYQGRLLDGAAAAQGEFDVTFSVYDTLAGGSPVASQIRVVTLAPADAGVFTVPDLNFTPALVDGSDLWLEVAIAPQNGSPVTLTPRQPLTATPRASYAARSGTSLQDAYNNGRVIEARTNEPVSIVPSQSGDVVQLSVGGVLDATPQILITSPTGTTARLFSQGLLLPEIPGSPLGFVASSTADGSSLRLDAASPADRVLLDTAQSGDASVQLPARSISPSELLAPTGLAEGFSGFTSLDTVTSDLFSATIVPPAAGYVLAILDYQIAISSSALNQRLAIDLGINTAPSGAASRGFQVIGGGASLVSDTFVVVDVFEIDNESAGTPFTLYAAGRIGSLNITNLGAATMKMIYLPADYNAAPEQPTGSAMAGELAALRAQIRSLEARLEALE
ncbi:MAG: hypothetical protein AAGI53_02895 [Planctomycetota bacterium]